MDQYIHYYIIQVPVFNVAAIQDETGLLLYDTILYDVSYNWFLGFNNSQMCSTIGIYEFINILGTGVYHFPKKCIKDGKVTIIELLFEFSRPDSTVMTENLVCIEL